MTKQFNLSTVTLPEFHRVALGFDRVFDDLHRNFANPATASGYPPHNVIQNGNNYRLELAVAGFKESEIEVEVKDRTLTITGHQEMESDETLQSYIHHGISNRDFTRLFTLGDDLEVVGANVENGILTVDIIQNIPEAKKPKKILITYKK